MCQFDDRLEVGMVRGLIRCVNCVEVRQARKDWRTKPSYLPLPWGVGCVNRASHLQQRPRVDGILIEMSFLRQRTPSRY
jgi:hypothetical protein